MTPYKFFFSKMQYGYKKTQNLMLILNVLKSCKQTRAGKVINKKVTDNWSF
jgi:hypothetical protein